MAATKKSKKDRAAEVLGSDEYLKKVLSLIPEAEQEEILSRLGDHVLRHDEFSRLSDEAAETKRKADEAAAAAQKKYDENVAWRENSNQWLAEKQKEIAAKEAALSSPAASLDPAKFVAKEEIGNLLAKARADGDAQSLAFLSAIDDIKEKHFKNFGEFLTTRQLVDHARKVGKPVDQAYDDLTRDRYQEKQEKEAKAVEDAMRARLTQEIRTQLGKDMPYPVSQADEMGNQTLGGLKPAEPKEAPKYGTAAAVAAMLRGELKPQA